MKWDECVLNYVLSWDEEWDISCIFLWVCVYYVVMCETFLSQAQYWRWAGTFTLVGLMLLTSSSEFGVGFYSMFRDGTLLL